MRLVLDTVVLVRATMGPARPQGRSGVDPFLDCGWMTSPDNVDEYQDVLDRPELGRRFRRLADCTVESLQEHVARSTKVEPAVVRRICRDPHDDMFLAAALASGANAIVSEDRDVLFPETFEGIRICTTRTIISMLSEHDARGNTP